MPSIRNPRVNYADCPHGNVLVFWSFTVMCLSVDLLLFILLGFVGLLKFLDSCILSFLSHYLFKNGHCPILSLIRLLLNLTLFSRSLNFSFMHSILCVSWLYSNDFFQGYFKVHLLSLWLLSYMLLNPLTKFLISIIFFISRHFTWFCKNSLVIRSSILFLAHIFKLVYSLNIIH